jgi:hypothetical protein
LPTITILTEEITHLRKQEQVERLPALTGGSEEGKEWRLGGGKGRTGGKPKPDIAILMLYEQ